MGSRIRTLQMQARELGRLRGGWSEGSRPVKSKTWVLTSPAEHYIEAAAAEWQGKVEKYQPRGNGAQQWRVITKAVSIDAILPPGDPMSQSLELWNKGGCARRCDGITEMLSDQPCICQEEYGPKFFEIAPKQSVCKMNTRLNVILPSMPDFGVWRAESNSYWSANEIAAAVDTLKGAAGPQALIPIRLRIEQRTKVAKGQTKHFPIVVVELRGATAGQVLEATTLTSVESGPARAAIEAARPDYVAQAKAAQSADEFRAVADAAAAAGHMDEALRNELAAIWRAQTAAPVGNAVSPDEDAEEVEPEASAGGECDRCGKPGHHFDACPTLDGGAS